jgi:hypothetical protein
MTRFLSLALADLECGGVNRETERLFTYHHGTKHSYRAVRTNTYFQEMLMLSREVDRLERWVMELTDKLNAHLKV